MKKLILLCTFAFLILTSCSKDIMQTEPNYIKKLLYTKITENDSLRNLTFSEVNLGSVSMMKIANQFISIRNISDNMTVTIRSIEGRSTSGLFNYSFPQGIPFTIAPSEDTQTREKVKLKFIADVFTVGMYYDTLVINKNPNFTIPIKVNVIY